MSSSRDKYIIMRNYKGEIISGKMELQDPTYGTGKTDAHGQPEADWSLLEHADREDKGFDVRYPIVEIILPKGTMLARYGSEWGRHTAPRGTPYEVLAMPYKKETLEYNEYKVIADNVKVSCAVQEGKIAPGFGSPGGGIQYWHHINIHESVRQGILEKVELKW